MPTNWKKRTAWALAVLVIVAGATWVRMAEADPG